MRTNRDLATHAMVVIAMAACAPAGSTVGPRTSPRVEAPDRSTIVVANYHLSEIVVYADDGSGRVRLGRVDSMSTGRFPAPRAFVDGGLSLQVVARPIGAEAEYVTSSIPMHPRQYVQLNVMNNLAISNWAAWPR